MPAINEISPWIEMGAYEYLWVQTGQTFDRLAKKLYSRPSRATMPSEFVPVEESQKAAEQVREVLEKAQVKRFGVRINGAGNYPLRLRDAKSPVHLLYYQGNWDLVETASVAVVGTRNPSPEGKARTRKITRQLVRDGFTIVSGLAKGVDTVAHTTAMQEGGRTIGVLGTPLSDTYPKENRDLQHEIAEKHLLISQVPVLRYRQQDYRWNRAFFPARNITMSALTSATIIIEAGEGSGTLIQAKAAIEQGRKLFILDSMFRTHEWPHRFAERGAIRVIDYQDIAEHLVTPAANS